MFLSPRIFRSGKIKSFSTVLGSIDSAITQRSLPAYQGIQLFYLCKEQADAAEWYKSWGVMENFHGNHGMLMMHIWMVNRRLLQFPDSPVRTEVQESLFEALWADTSARIRAAGISEISVNARLKDVQSWSLPTCMELDHAYTLLHGLQKDSSNQTNADLRGPSAVIDAIGGTIWRQIFQKKAVSAADLPDDQSMAVTETMVEQLASYVYHENESLCETISSEDFIRGCFRFGTVPSFSHVKRLLNDGGNAAATEYMRSSRAIPNPRDYHAVSDVSTIPVDGRMMDDALEAPLWLKAMHVDGKTYYWNTQTMNSQWEKPADFDTWAHSK